MTAQADGAWMIVSLGEHQHVLWPQLLDARHCENCAAWYGDALLAFLPDEVLQMHVHIKRSFPRRRIIVFFKNVYNSSEDARVRQRASLTHSLGLLFRDEKMEKLEERGEIELFKEKSQLSTYYCPSEVLKSPNEAMEFLSRTWSPSSSDFSQILWSNGRELNQGLQEQQTEESLVQFEEVDKTRLEQALTLLSTGYLVRSGKLKQLHFGWMNVGRMKAWLGVELFSSLSRGCREKRKEKVRLREARVHAALSVARLAAAIAGISANSRLEPTNAKSTSMTGMGGGALDEKMNAVVASAAALVATVCAEAAESVGASRERVASAISTGLATKTSADMVTLTATCLRGAATLELRAEAGRHASEDQKTLARGARLPVRMPEGKVRQRLVYIFLKRDKLRVRLRRKHIRGVISTYTEYTIFNAMEDLKEGGISKDDHGFYSITLGTNGGAIQIMFEQQVQYRIWRSTICHLLCDC